MHFVPSVFPVLIPYTCNGLLNCLEILIAYSRA